MSNERFNAYRREYRKRDYVKAQRKAYAQEYLSRPEVKRRNAVQRHDSHARELGKYRYRVMAGEMFDLKEMAEKLDMSIEKVVNRLGYLHLSEEQQKSLERQMDIIREERKKKSIKNASDAKRERRHQQRDREITEYMKAHPDASIDDIGRAVRRSIERVAYIYYFAHYPNATEEDFEAYHERWRNKTQDIKVYLQNHPEETYQDYKRLVKQYKQVQMEIDPHTIQCESSNYRLPQSRVRRILHARDRVLDAHKNHPDYTVEQIAKEAHTHVVSAATILFVLGDVMKISIERNAQMLHEYFTHVDFATLKESW